jgi:hypothetical protein
MLLQIVKLNNHNAMFHHVYQVNIYNLEKTLFLVA